MITSHQFKTYSQLPSVYTKQIEWAKREGYENCNALYEVYVTNPTEASKEKELVTEVYYPVRKKVPKALKDRKALQSV